MIEIKQTTLLTPTEVCKNCYARSILGIMAVEYLKRNTVLQDVSQCNAGDNLSDFPSQWVRMDSIMDAFYCLGIIPVDIYVGYQQEINDLFNGRSTWDKFVKYVNSLDVRIFET